MIPEQYPNRPSHVFQSVLFPRFDGFELVQDSAPAQKSKQKQRDKTKKQKVVEHGCTRFRIILSGMGSMVAEDTPPHSRNEC